MAAAVSRSRTQAGCPISSGEPLTLATPSHNVETGIDAHGMERYVVGVKSKYINDTPAGHEVLGCSDSLWFDNLWSAVFHMATRRFNGIGYRVLRR